MCANDARWHYKGSAQVETCVWLRARPDRRTSVAVAHVLLLLLLPSPPLLLRPLLLRRLLRRRRLLCCRCKCLCRCPLARKHHTCFWRCFSSTHSSLIKKSAEQMQGVQAEPSGQPSPVASSPFCTMSTGLVKIIPT